MITIDQIKALNPIELIVTNNYSKVINNVQPNTFSLKSKSGHEFIYTDGEVFYHSDGKDFFVQLMEQDIDVLKKLLDK